MLTLALPALAAAATLVAMWLFERSRAPEPVRVRARRR